MSVNDIAYLPENPAHDRAIEQINAEAFGPGRFTRAAYPDHAAVVMARQ